MCNSCTVEKNAYFPPLDFLLCEVEIFFQPGFIDLCLSLKWVVEASVRILEQGRVTDKLSSYSGQRIHGESSSFAKIFGEMAPLGMGHSRWRRHGRGSAGLAVWAPQPWWCACRRTSVEHLLDGSYSSKHHACSGLGELSVLLPLYCLWETGAHLRFTWAMSSCRGPPPPTFKVPERNPAATRCQITSSEDKRGKCLSEKAHFPCTHQSKGGCVDKDLAQWIICLSWGGAYNHKMHRREQVVIEGSRTSCDHPGGWYY